MNPMNEQPEEQESDFDPLAAYRPQEDQPEEQESDPLSAYRPKSKEEDSEQSDNSYPERKEPEKLGKYDSFMAGMIEGTYGLAQTALEQPAEGLAKLGEYAFGEKQKKLPKDRFDVLGINDFMRELPESKDESSRRLRVAGQTAPLSAIGGIQGIIYNLVGSQVGQTVREVFGKEGKFDEFGVGEAGAMALDLLTSLGLGVGLNAAQNYRATKPINTTPPILKNNRTGLERKVVQNSIQNQESALRNIIDNFSQEQIRGFENEAVNLSPNRFSEMTRSNASSLQRHADEMFRTAQLDNISPLRTTPEQSGRALQQAANTIFNDEVIQAERTAYSTARQEAEGLSGQAPRTLREARELRENLTRNEPTPEQRAVVSYLDDLIADLETTTPASSQPASKLLDSKGNPITPASEIPASSAPTTKSANDLVDLVQKGNNAVNYGSELRLQSHRLQPILNTLRQEVGSVLRQKPAAAAAYQNANQLHGRNAEVWGTKYMRNMRFAENPESIVTASKKASNMRNMKQAILDPTIQALGERMVVADITKSGSSASNRIALESLNPELSPMARHASEQLVNVKDPLTVSGGRAALRNSILKDVASSVNTGLPPTKVLELMSTPKGYQMVRESLAGSQQSRQVFQSMERLFLEDVMTSIQDPSGQINFSKARNVLQNPETRQVLHQIGGDRLIQRFRTLENISANIDTNLSLYSKPEVQSVFKNLVHETKSAAFLGTVLHALDVPWPVIAGLGLAKTTGKLTYQALQKRVLSNPRAVHYLEQFSKARTVREVERLLPRLLNVLDKTED